MPLKLAALIGCGVITAMARREHRQGRTGETGW